MTYTEAIAKLNDMAVKNEYSKTEATEAIERIMQAPTHNATSKDALLAIIRYLLRCLQNVGNCPCKQTKQPTWHVFHYRDMNEDEQKEHPDWTYIIGVDCVPNNGERILYYRACTGDIYEDEWDDDWWAERGETVNTMIEDGDAWMEMPKGPEQEWSC